jgi:transglutaminase-like putative cysteine protease
VTPKGKLLSAKMLMIEFLRTTKEEALAAGKVTGPKIESLVKLTGGIPVFEGLESMTVTVEVKGDTDGKIIKSNDYQEVEATTGRYEVKLLPRPAPRKGKETLPITVTDKELERYAKPATYIQSGHRDIKAAAEKVVGNEKEPVAAARKLCEWVFRTLKKESPKTGMASALETLESGTGDCSEHAALFCALARAVGLPSREAFGIAIAGPAAGYHAWSEVLIDGKWVVVDAANMVFGVPPAYLLLGHSDGSHSDVSDSTSSFARLFSNCSATVTEGVRRGKKFDPRDPATFHTLEGDTYYNRLFDVTIDVSGGWKALMHGPQAVQLTSPSSVVMVVSAVFGSIPSEKEWKDLGAGFRAASGATNFNRRDDAKLAGLGARAFSFTLARGQTSLDGRLRVACSGANVYTVVVMGASMFKFTEKALSEPFGRLKFGPPKKPEK